VQAFTTSTRECDVTITEDVVDKLIHRRLLEATLGIRPAAESGGTLDLLGQEVADICARL